jgi:hypothetical protein
MTGTIAKEEREQILRHPALPVAGAILRLGYKPESGIWSAALRMMRTPDIANDLIAYVAAGYPADRAPEKIPPQLLRSLPHGMTVASLIRGFRFRPVGAFLIASDLVASPEPTLRLLGKFIKDGVWVTDDAGRHSLMLVPPVAGITVDETDKEEEPITRNDLVELMELLESRYGANKGNDTARSGKTCKACGAELSASTQFCQQCGTKIPPAGSHQRPARPVRKICPGCGKPVREGLKFCSNCGSPV